MDAKELKEYEKLGIDPPTSVSHGVTADDIRSKMVRATCANWRLIGNQLYCDTDLGPHMQTISPNYILRGTDSDGMPVLVKLEL